VYFLATAQGLKPIKFVTATIKILCHPSHPTDFLTTQILGGHVTSRNQGRSPNDQGKQRREIWGTRLPHCMLRIVRLNDAFSGILELEASPVRVQLLQQKDKKWMKTRGKK